MPLARCRQATTRRTIHVTGCAGGIRVPVDGDILPQAGRVGIIPADLRLEVTYPAHRCRRPRPNQPLIVVLAVVTGPEQVTQHISDVRAAGPYAGDHDDARFNSPCSRSAIASRRPTILAPTSPKPGSCPPGDTCTAWTRADRAANTSR